MVAILPSGERIMKGRCLFIADEIACAYVDDFCNLPFIRVLGYVIAPLSEAQQRHRDCFALVH